MTSKSVSSIKRNILANYLSQLYVMGIGVVMAPVYLRYMGVEAYGLIGFFTMMGAWFQLLDLAMTPTLIREIACYRGGAITAGLLWRLMRLLEMIFGSLAVLGGIALVMSSGWIAGEWLKVQHLTPAEVKHAVMLIGISVPMRCMSALYRGVACGFERQVWLGKYNVVIATLRFVGVLLVLNFLGATPVHFFSYQAAVATLELAGLMVMSYRLMPRKVAVQGRLTLSEVSQNLTFTFMIATTGFIGVVVTQLDKLVLSNKLALPAYGVFSLAVVVAGAIAAVGPPVGQALLPHLTKLITERKEHDAKAVYGRSTQLVCILSAPATALMVFFAEPLLLAWTNHPAVAKADAVVTGLYAIGNLLQNLSSFSYYILFAKGDLKLHFAGRILFLITIVPFVFWAAKWGGTGTGVVWACVNALYLLGWVYFIHRRAMPGLHWRWLLNDVAPIVASSAVVAWVARMFIHIPTQRPLAILTLCGIGSAILLAAAMSSSFVRKALPNLAIRLYPRGT